MCLGDECAYEDIMMEREPSKILKEGNKIIVNKTKDIWQGIEKHEMLAMNQAKYTQSAGLCSTLLATGTTTLIGCSPNDKHWEIGLNVKDPEKMNKIRWGENLMGRC